MGRNMTHEVLKQRINKMRSKMSKQRNRRDKMHFIGGDKPCQQQRTRKRKKGQRK